MDYLTADDIQNGVTKTLENLFDNEYYKNYRQKVDNGEEEWDENELEKITKVESYIFKPVNLFSGVYGRCFEEEINAIQYGYYDIENLRGGFLAVIVTKPEGDKSLLIYEETEENCYDPDPFVFVKDDAEDLTKEIDMLSKMDNIISNKIKNIEELVESAYNNKKIPREVVDLLCTKTGEMRSNGTLGCLIYELEFLHCLADSDIDLSSKNYKLTSAAISWLTKKIKYDAEDMPHDHEITKTYGLSKKSNDKIDNLANEFYEILKNKKKNLECVLSSVYS